MKQFYTSHRQDQGKNAYLLAGGNYIGTARQDSSETAKRTMEESKNK